ncbi:MAG: amino acid permease [Chloroflexi bacterium]|nr:MAG: amino acid permease [Chloroflexota bacterium]
MPMSESTGQSLKRELDARTGTLFTAAMIVGTGIFAALGAATDAAGTGVLVAMLLGGTVALATGISAAQLGVNNPEEGGAFTWARAFGHETIGFIAGCGYLGKAIVSTSVVALMFATYLGQVVPDLPVRVVAPVAVLAVTGFNILGIELTSRVLIGLLAVLVGLLAIYCATAFHAVDPARLVPIFGDKGLAGVLTGAALFFWSWDGFMRTAIMASEMKEPRRSIPIMFLTVGAITLGVEGAQQVGAQDTPLLSAAATAAGSAVWAVFAAALVATFYDIIGILLTASRVGLAMARARELPGWLAGVHARFRTPYRSVIALGLVSALLALAFDLRSLLAVASAFMVVWYLVTHQAALELSKDKRIASPLFSWYGVVGCVALVLSLPPLATAAAAGVLTALVGVRSVLRRTPRRATPG